MDRSVLVVDDDAHILDSLARALTRADFEVRTAPGADEALRELGRGPAGVALVDLKMPGTDGMTLLRLLRERVPEVDVIMMTAYDDLPTIAEAMREGAVDFLVKPLDLTHLRRLLERIFEDRGTRSQARPLKDTGDGTPKLLGHDPAMIEIFKLVGQVATTRTNVVIRGESGTGKEAVHVRDRKCFAKNAVCAAATLSNSTLG
jgi:DNA-binding NtrC family response regulator